MPEIVENVRKKVVLIELLHILYISRLDCILVKGHKYPNKLVNYFGRWFIASGLNFNVVYGAPFRISATCS